MHTVAKLAGWGDKGPYVARLAKGLTVTPFIYRLVYQI